MIYMLQHVDINIENNDGPMIWKWNTQNRQHIKFVDFR